MPYLNHTRETALSLGKLTITGTDLFSEATKFSSLNHDFSLTHLTTLQTCLQTLLNRDEITESAYNLFIIFPHSDLLVIQVALLTSLWLKT